jgi:hypothetical protein
MVDWPLQMGKGVKVRNSICGTSMSFPKRSNPIKNSFSTFLGRVKWLIKVVSEITLVIIDS